MSSRRFILPDRIARYGIKYYAVELSVFFCLRRCTVLGTGEYVVEQLSRLDCWQPVCSLRIIWTSVEQSQTQEGGMDQ